MFHGNILNILNGKIKIFGKFEMKIPSLKDNFGPEILERGRTYYKEGRVKNLIVDGKTIAAVVAGNRNYRVRMDLTKRDFKCTCPCDFNCKHMAAVLYVLRENKEVETINNLKNQLNKKSKKELVGVLQKILVSEPRFKTLISNNTKDIKNLIKSLNMDYEEDVDTLIDDVDQLYELIMEKDKKLDTFVTLFKQCFSIWEDFGGVEPLEDSMFTILETISKEAKKLPKEKRQALLQELVNLTREYDFFWDSIDDKGIRLQY